MERLPKKSQVAVDFLVSYGIAILIVTVSIYVVLRLGVFGGTLTPSSCNPAPGFGCTDVALSQNGLMIMVFSQATGGAITINGAACSTAINTTGNGPLYGNTKVQASSQFSSGYSGGSFSPITMYSGTSASIQIVCFSSSGGGIGGGVQTSTIGSTQTDYVWLNYTTTGLPSGVYTVQRAFQFTTKAS
jgi:hypothetical protein